jgi:hypothetical protein
MASCEQALVPRATRYPLCIPLSYRDGGRSGWHACETVNISRTGILFRTDKTLAIDSTVDIRVDFPNKRTLSCQGLVVRSQDSAYAVRIKLPRMIRYKKTP